MINLAEPETIDLRAVHLGKKQSIFQKHENLNTAISSAKVSLFFKHDRKNNFKRLRRSKKLFWKILKIRNILKDTKKLKKI